MATIKVRDIKVGTRAAGNVHGRWPMTAVLISKKKVGNAYDLLFRAEDGYTGGDLYPGDSPITLA